MNLPLNIIHDIYISSSKIIIEDINEPARVERSPEYQLGMYNNCTMLYTDGLRNIGGI